jgi:DNA invertase Pin-like site-specific DNA recombinase
LLNDWAAAATNAQQIQSAPKAARAASSNASNSNAETTAKPTKTTKAMMKSKAIMWSIVRRFACAYWCNVWRLHATGRLCTVCTMNAGTKVVGYARISKTDLDKNGRSLDGQAATIKAECERRGWTLLDVVRDDGYSGKDANRPGLAKALQHIADGEADGLIVARLDRLSRSTVDFGVILEWLERASATFLALDIGIDTSEPGGKLVANTLVNAAQYEREITAARTKNDLAQARAKGLAISRPAFADTDDGRRLRDRIRALHDAGASYAAIAAQLDAEHVPTLRGAEKWSRSSVQSACRTKPRPPAARKLAVLPRR